MAGIITFILGAEYGGQKKPWDSGTVIGLFVGCGLIWIAFGVWEYFNGERAMLQRRLLNHRYVWQSSAFQFFFAAGYFILLYYLPVYFQSVDNRTAIGSGVLNLPLVLAMVVGSITSGTLVTKTGHAAPFQLIGGVFCTIASGLYVTPIYQLHVRHTLTLYLQNLHLRYRNGDRQVDRVSAHLRPCHRDGIPDGHYHRTSKRGYRRHVFGNCHCVL
jgi:Na+/melibiose symporter-like transporter